MQKNRFYLYTEYLTFLDEMTDEDQAQLFRTIFDYESGEELEELSPAVRAVFSFIKNRLDNEPCFSSDQKERRTGEYQKFRKAVLKRDGYRCRNCGSLKNLHVHHIRKFSLYPDLRTDTDNGITLCAVCHRKEHKK